MSDPVGLYKQKYLGPGVATVPTEQPDPVAAYKASYLPKGALPDTLKLISPQPSDVTVTPTDKSQVSVPTPQPRLEDLLSNPDLSPEQRDRITRLIHVQRGQAGGEVETPDPLLKQFALSAAQGALSLPVAAAKTFGVKSISEPGERFISGIEPTLSPTKSPTLQGLAGAAGELAGGFVPATKAFQAGEAGANLLGALVRTAAPKTAEAATAAISRAASRVLSSTGSEVLARAVATAPRELAATGLFMAATDPQALATPQGVGMTLLLATGGSLVRGKQVTTALAKTIDARRAQAFLVKALDQPTPEVDPVITQKAAAAQAKQAELEGRRAARAAWTGATPEMRAILVPEFGADVHATEWKSLTKEQKTTVIGKFRASLGKMAEVVENQAPTAAPAEAQPSIIQRVQDAINGAIEQPERRAPERLTDEEYFRITGETREQQAARQAADVTTRMPTVTPPPVAQAPVEPAVPPEPSVVGEIRPPVRTTEESNAIINEVTQQHNAWVEANLRAAGHDQTTIEAIKAAQGKVAPEEFRRRVTERAAVIQEAQPATGPQDVQAQAVAEVAREISKKSDVIPINTLKNRSRLADIQQFLLSIEPAPESLREKNARYEKIAAEFESSGQIEDAETVRRDWIKPEPAPEPGRVVGEIKPAAGASPIRAMLERSAERAEIESRVDEIVDEDTRDVLARHDDLGFDTPEQAAAAIINHPDWRKRWDVRDDTDAALLEDWRGKAKQKIAEIIKSRRAIIGAGGKPPAATPQDARDLITEAFDRRQEELAQKAEAEKLIAGQEPPKVEAPAETAKPPEEGHPALSEPLGKTLDELDDQIDVIDELSEQGKITNDEFKARLSQITAAKDAIKTQAKAKNVVTVTRRALERSALQQLDDTTLRTMQAKLIGERNTAESEITRQSVLHDLNAVQRELRWRKDVKELSPQSLDTHANELKADWLEARDEATKQQIANRAGQVEREIMRRARPSPVDTIKNEKGAISFNREPLGGKIPDDAPDYARRVYDHLVIGNFDKVFPSVTDAWFNKGEKVYAHTVRGTYALDKFDKRFGKTGAPAVESAGQYAELLQGSLGRSQNALETGSFIDWNSPGTPVTKWVDGLKEILEPLKGREWEFQIYDASMITLERGRTGKPTGISLNDAVRVIRNAKPDVILAGQKASDFSRAVFKYYTDSGMFNEELRAKLVEFMSYYGPIDRILAGKAPQSRIERVGAKVRQTLSSVGGVQQVKEFKGSSSKFVEGIQARVDQTRRLMVSADKQRLSDVMVRSAEANPTLAKGLIWRDLKATPGEIDPAIKVQAENLRKWSTDQGIEMTSQQSEEIALAISDRRLRTRSDKLYYWRDGKREVWNLAPELAQAYSSLSPQELHMFVRIIGFLPSNAKQLITDNPAFAFFNAVRDTYDAAIQSKYGFRVGIDSFRGFLEALDRGEFEGKYHTEFRGSAGTAGGIGARSIETTERATRAVLGETKTFRHPLDALRAFALPFEEAARLGEFIRAREAGASVADAAIAAQRVTTNFRQMGLSMRSLSHMTMFLNPAIQSLDANIRAMIQQPGRVLAVGAGAITLPTIILWAANHGDKEIEELRKSRFGGQFNYFRIPDAVPLIGGQIGKLPKPFLFGQLFGSSIEDALDKAFDDDPTAGGRFIDALWTQVGFNVIPNTLDYTLGLIANKDFSTGADIAPRAEGNEQVSPRYQFNPTTGATARTLGDMFNISPAKIEFAVRNALGTLGQDALRGIDMVTDARAKYPTPVAADLPIVGRLLARYPTQGSFSIQRFYTDAEKSERASNDLKLLEASGKIEKAKALAADKGFEIGSAEVYAEARKALADLRGTASFVIELPANAMTPDRKREIVNNILSQMTEYARRVNEGVEAARKSFKASRK